MAATVPVPTADAPPLPRGTVWVLAVGCGLAGLDASYQLSTASGATIAATILVVYLLALGGVTLRRRSAPPAGPGGPAVR